MLDVDLPKMERMDDERLTKQIYKASLDGHVGKGRPRKMDQIAEQIERCQGKSTRNRRLGMYITRCMDLEEAREVCQKRPRCRSIVSAYCSGIKALVYLCMI